MFSHYLLTALRGFRRQWITSSINVIGLALGLACFFGALGYVRYFASDDRQYAGADRTYYVRQQLTAPGVSFSLNTVPWAMADMLELELPNTELIARATTNDARSVTVGERTTDLQASFAEPQFLEVFPQKFVAGDAARALAEPGRVVVTRDVAMRLFGTAAALGRTLLLEDTEPLTVAGVIENPTQPSHFGTVDGNLLRFDILVSAATLPEFLTKQQGAKVADAAMHDFQGTLNTLTYVRMPRTDAESLSRAATVLDSFAHRHGMNESTRHFGLVPISQLRNRARDDWGISLAAVLTAAAGFVLLVSALNYANLATALALARQRELGVRCVLGAARRQIALQLLIDASVALSIATAIAFALIAGCRELLFARLNADLTFAWSQSSFWIIAASALVGLVALLCCYPVLVLSRLRLASSLQQGRAASPATKGARGLVTLQFLLAALLLLTLSLARLQLQVSADHAREAISAPIVAIDNNLQAAGVELDVLRQELLAQPGIEAVAATDWTPFGGTYGVSYLLSGPDSAHRAALMNQGVTKEYFATVGVKVLAGRMPTPSDNPPTEVIIDRSAATQLGWADASAAAGQLIYPGTVAREGIRAQGEPMRIVAVVENNVLQTNYGGATASMYRILEHSKIPLIRLSKTELQRGRAAIDTVWAKLAPRRVLYARFLDERIDDFLARDRNQAELMARLTGLTIAIALMGLAGMSIHLANRRRHEVAVRKTLGARTTQVLGLLLTELSLPILIGNVLAWPAAYLLARKYSESFVYRAPFSFAACAVTLVVALALAWVCAGWYSLRTARLNPAEVLRDQ